jgi:hypothetical protein
MLHRQRPLDALLPRSDPGRLAVATCVEAKETPHRSATARPRPLLLIDIDGVISLFGFPLHTPGHPRSTAGSFHSIDGILHFLSAVAAEHLLALSSNFELVWASGWEEKANEYLPRLLGLPRSLPFLTFERSPGRANAHWKLDAIERFAGPRALAWIDDAFNDACHEWAAARDSPTLLVGTSPATGLTQREAEQLAAWARTLAH